MSVENCEENSASAAYESRTTAGLRSFAVRTILLYEAITAPESPAMQTPYSCRDTKSVWESLIGQDLLQRRDRMRDGVFISGGKVTRERDALITARQAVCRDMRGLIDWDVL